MERHSGEISDPARRTIRITLVKGALYDRKALPRQFEFLATDYTDLADFNPFNPRNPWPLPDQLRPELNLARRCDRGCLEHGITWDVCASAIN